MTPQRLAYCQFIQATQINYTQTYMADHHPHLSHDAINRYLQDDNVSPAVAWAATKDTIDYSENACLIFDDSVLDNAVGHKKLPFRAVLMDS